jgi:ankyrin repeat protein
MHRLSESETETPLILAATIGWVCAVAELCNFGADINRTCKGETALTRAIANRHNLLAADLLSRGATTNVFDDTGRSALSIAAECGCFKLVCT